LVLSAQRKIIINNKNIELTKKCFFLLLSFYTLNSGYLKMVVAFEAVVDIDIGIDTFF